jgi:hypothetical protein
MNQRQKKKRGQAKKIDALERGNQYLADLTGRLMEEKAVIQKGFKQIESIYQMYIQMFVWLHDNEVGLSVEEMKRVNKTYSLNVRPSEDKATLWFENVERDDALWTNTDGIVGE